ncbi:MAG: 50S ribosomal protein L24 [Candidatus Aenigmarchaeota archaeon]|nr:50S ribosomal protein L24 [Candidatus Aenigmarchaeota archaeon]
MKSEFSTKWKASKQPRKQRKYRHNAPLHIRHRFLSAHLSRELAKRFRRKSIPVRKGDEVEVMRGEFRKFRGNVERVDMGRGRVYVEGVKIKKADGSEVLRAIDASNVRLTKLNLGDKYRQRMLERKGKVTFTAEETAAKENKGEDKKGRGIKAEGEKKETAMDKAEAEAKEDAKTEEGAS